MRNRNRQRIGAFLCIAGLALAIGACGKSSDSKPSASGTGEQTVCPMSGHEVDKSVVYEHEGKKVYFCCAGCIEKFKADPEKYKAKLPQFGGKETPGEGS